MRILDRCLVIAGMAGAMAWAPSLMAQDKDRDMRDQGSVQEAIRFEKAKQAAADRQEAIEAGQARPKASKERRDSKDSRRHGDADRSAPPAPQKDIHR